MPALTVSLMKIRPAALPACISAEVWAGVRTAVAAMPDSDLARAVAEADRRARHPGTSGSGWHSALTLLLAGVEEEARRINRSGTPEAHALAATSRATAAVTQAVTWLTR